VLFITFIRGKNKMAQSILKGDLDYQKRLHEVELTALRGQMNPHFVHNSLNAIQYYIQRNEVELSEKYLVRFSKLIRLFFEYSRRKEITIKDEVYLLENYLEIEKLRFEEKLNYTIQVDAMIEEEEQTVPSMLLQPLVENAVNHGIFHKKDPGHITISFKQLNPTNFEVIIEDDGIGIHKAQELYARSSQKYESRSSLVFQERLELLNRTDRWNIAYQITDVSDTTDLTGTRIQLIFNQTQHNEN
jgi:sensor histidine kinase YesM